MSSGGVAVEMMDEAWWMPTLMLKSGLYAAGNNSASVMGRTYAGPGSTIGPAMVFGMIGGRRAATMAGGKEG